MKTFEYAIKGLRAPFYKLSHKNDPHFECPICGYCGPFMAKKQRLHAKCPRCGEVERMRLQFLVMQEFFAQNDVSQKSLLHVAPENALRKWFKTLFGHYTSCDLHRKDVDENFDLQSIPHPDASFDMVYCSHVLVYPEDYQKAIREVRRVLKPGGIAIMPEPIGAMHTHEYTAPNPNNHFRRDHGPELFDDYRKVFGRVEMFDARNYPAKYQLFVYNGERAAKMPLHHQGGWSYDVVPFCYV